MPEIVITRGGGYQDRLRAYKIMIDGKKRGSIKRNETQRLEIFEGEHQLQLKIDWAGSSKLQINVEQDSLKFTCGPGRWPLPLVAFYAVFMPNKWILLEPEVACSSSDVSPPQSEERT